MGPAITNSRLTDQQRTAIEIRDHAVTLSAGAGCGKTLVLTERFLSYLAPDADPRRELHEIVAFTYTDRAAREMRDRIRSKCRQRLHDAVAAAEDDETKQSEVQHWTQLIRQLDSAQVSSIHSFCATFLRSCAVQAGIDPLFSVIEPAIVMTLQTELIDDELRERLRNRDEHVIELATLFDLSSLRQRLETLLNVQYASQLREFRGIDLAEIESRWNTFAEEESRRMATSIQSHPQTQKLMALLETNEFDTPEMIERREQLFRLSRLEDCQNLGNELGAIREHLMLNKLRAAKYWPDPEVKKQFGALAKPIRDRIDKIASTLVIDPDKQCETIRVSGMLLELAISIQDKYQARKDADRVLDFDDIVMRTARLLSDPNHLQLRRQWSRRISALLVDESQDTNPIQAKLIDALCGGRPDDPKLFVVGDYKQSIYRFQGADPEVFQQRRETTPEAGRLPLSINFRSQPAILNFVNALFHDRFGTEFEPLVANRKQSTQTPAIEFIWPISPVPKGSAGAADANRAEEADWIARRIVTLIEDGAPLIVEEDSQDGQPAKTRAACPGDIAILFRSLSNIATYEAALQRFGIDYYLVGGKAFYSQQEIFDVTNLLKTLAHPADEMALTGLLRSPFFSISDESLYWLSLSESGLSGGLFQEDLPSQIESSQHERVLFAAETIRELRDAKDQLSITELLNRAMALSGYDAALLAEFLGERKLANLHKIMDQARAFDVNATIGLPDFVMQLEEFISQKPSEALAATNTESGNVVRLMTIHQSKGLEFPVVIVADADHSMNSRPTRVHFDPHLGAMTNIPKKDGSPSKKSDGGTALDIFNRKESEADLAETDRLLYVATTRAADYLIIAGGLFDPHKLQGPWTKLIAEKFYLLTGDQKVESDEDLASAVSARVIDSRPEPKQKKGTTSRRKNFSDFAAEIAPEKSPRQSESLYRTRRIQPDGSARRVVSFSRISGQFEQPTQSVAFQQDESRPDGLELGNLAHNVLNMIDFRDSPPKTDLPNIVRRSASALHIPDPRTQDDVINLVERFLQSSIAGQLFEAAHLHRELEFLVRWPLGKNVTNESKSTTESSTLIRGFIDCLCQDREGHWHLLDYKTNNIRPADVPRVAQSYEAQMWLYALAVEQSLGTPPKSATLFFMRPGVAYPVDWNDASRERLAEFIDQGTGDLDTS